MLNETPISVFLSLLETEFGCSRRSVSAILLADREVKWGRKKRNARQVATGPGDKRQLTDYVSNALPGSIPHKALADLRESIPELLGLIAREARASEEALGSAEVYHRVADLLTEKYAFPMTCALEDYACAEDIFDNVLDSVRISDFEGDRQRASAALALYVTTAFLGDTERAANMTVQYCSGVFGVYLLEEMDPEEAENEEDAPVEIGVQRIIRGDVRGRRHTLDPAGTMFGSVPDTEGDFVADVNNSVSYQHLSVFQGEGGAWYAEGLGSRYGTYIERPGCEGRIVVELPESERETDDVEPVKILPGDVLVLGSTRFEVQLFQRGA